MMVHRVGHSLLLDEFDVGRHLFRGQSDDWRWLKEFFLDNVVQTLAQKVKIGSVTGDLVVKLVIGTSTLHSTGQDGNRPRRSQDATGHRMDSGAICKITGQTDQKYLVG